MQYFKILCFSTAIFLGFWGCNPSTGSEGSESDNGGGDSGNNSETVEYNLSVSTDPSEGGTAEPADSTYEEDAEVTVEAIPNEDWVFDGWTGDRESEENPLSFSIGADTDLTANFSEETSEEPAEYSLSVSAAPAGGGAVDPSEGTYEEDAEVTVEATSNEGWKFDGWTGDRESGNNPLSFQITEDTELKANFLEASGDEPAEYSLTVSTDPSNGGSVDPSSGTYEEGTKITIEATSNKGFNFVEWTGDQQSTDNPLTFTIAKNTEITAVFAQKEQPEEYSLSVSAFPSEGGSVKPAEGTYEENAEVTVEATSKEGWIFDGWTGDINSDKNPLSVTITSDINITANFKARQYDLNVSAQPDQAGETSPDGGIYEHGTTVTVNATANTGWKFSEWTGDKESNENPVAITITKDTELQANFDQTKHELTVTTEPSEGGTVDPNSGSYLFDSEVLIEATANEGWAFDGWTGDRESEENPLSFNIQKDTRLTATFKETIVTHNLTTSASPSEGGSVSPSEGSYEEGTEVTVEAIPNEGWTFDGWTGDRESAENPLNFSIGGDTDLTANFSKLAEYSLSVSADPSEGGSVIPSSGTYQVGTQVSVVAEAQPGWEFTHWSGDKFSEAKELIFDINQNTNLVAHFNKKEYELDVQAEPLTGGSVTPSGGTYSYGTDVELDADVNSGWNFVKWSGDVESTENPLIITIKENMNVSANFERVKAQYTVNINVHNQDDVINLSLGQRNGATGFGFDEEWDKYAPPEPPQGILYAYFSSETGDPLFKDFRPDLSKNETWNLEYQVGHQEQVSLEWSISDDSKIPGTLILTDQAQSFEVNMLNQNSYTFTGSASGTLVIEYEYSP